MALLELLAALEREAGDRIARDRAAALAEAERITTEARARLTRRQEEELARATAGLQAEAERSHAQASRAAEQEVLTSRDALLERVLALGRERLQTRAPAATDRGAITALLTDALGYLDGGPLEVHASPALLELFRGTLDGRPDHTLTAAPAVIAGGIIQGESGRVTVDASLGGRLAARGLEARIVILKLLEAEG